MKVFLCLWPVSGFGNVLYFFLQVYNLHVFTQALYWKVWVHNTILKIICTWSYDCICRKEWTLLTTGSAQSCISATAKNNLSYFYGLWTMFQPLQSLSSLPCFSFRMCASWKYAIMVYFLGLLNSLRVLIELFLTQWPFLYMSCYPLKNPLLYYCGLWWRGT